MMSQVQTRHQIKRNLTTESSTSTGTVNTSSKMATAPPASKATNSGSVKPPVGHSQSTSITKLPKSPLVRDNIESFDTTNVTNVQSRISDLETLAKHDVGG